MPLAACTNSCVTGFTLHSLRKQLTGRSRSKPVAGVYYSSLFHCCDKHCVPGTLQKEEFIWAHGPRGMSLSWRSGRRLGDWSSQLRVNVLPTSTGAERANKTRKTFTLKAHPVGTPPPARPCLLSLPKPCRQLGTKCSNAGHYGRGGTFIIQAGHQEGCVQDV